MSDNTSPLVQPTTDHALEPAPQLPEIAPAPPVPTLTATQKTATDKPQPKKDYALITGASSGIGEALARLLASKKKPLILIGRSEEKLKKVAEDLRSREGIDARFLAIDLARSKTLPELPAALKRMGIRVDVLINAAGFGKSGPEASQKYEDSLNTINLNCRATLALTKLFLPDMLARKKGAIINVAAAIGLFPVPNMATYAASKAFVISWSQALAQETKNSGVRVLCACPGPTATRFYARAGINTSTVPHLRSLNDPQTVAEQILAALKGGKTLAVVGDQPFLMKYLPKLIPQSLLLKYGSTLLDETA